MIEKTVKEFKGYRLDDFNVHFAKRSAQCWINIQPGYDYCESLAGPIFHELEYLGSRTYNTPGCNTSREVLTEVLMITNLNKSFIEYLGDRASLTQKTNATYRVPLLEQPEKVGLTKFKRMKFFA